MQPYGCLSVFDFIATEGSPVEVGWKSSPGSKFKTNFPQATRPEPGWQSGRRSRRPPQPDDHRRRVPPQNVYRSIVVCIRAVAATAADKDAWFSRPCLPPLRTLEPTAAKIRFPSRFQGIASNSSEMSTKQTFRQAKTYVALRIFMQTDPTGPALLQRRPRSERPEHLLQQRDIARRRSVLA